MKRILHLFVDLWRNIDPVGKVTLVLFAILFAVVLPIYFNSAHAQVAQSNESLPKVMWVTEFDGCEYVVWQNTDYGHGQQYFRYMTHKGNCKYCQQRLEQQLKNYQ